MNEAGGASSVRHDETVMGTVVSFDLRVPDAVRADVFRALASARAFLHRVDAVFSTWKHDSPVSRLRRGEIALEEAPPVVAEVLELCRAARDASGGWFDPWAVPGGVDPTGLVKGWAAGQAARRLADAGASGVMVNAGGDVATTGEPEPGRPWRIGVRDPADRARVVAVVLSPGAVATSGAYERGDHVLDPATGEPAHRVASATVTGTDLGLADALATGLVAAGQEGVAAVVAAGCEALIITADGELHATPGLPLGE